MTIDRNGLSQWGYGKILSYSSSGKLRLVKLVSVLLQCTWCYSSCLSGNFPLTSLPWCRLGVYLGCMAVIPASLPLQNVRRRIAATPIWPCLSLLVPGCATRNCTSLPFLLQLFATTDLSVKNSCKVRHQPDEPCLGVDKKSMGRIERHWVSS